jgi:hypothetical protein
MKGQVKEDKSKTGVTFTWENSRMANITDLEFIHGKTVTDTKEIGFITRNRVMVSILIMADSSMKGIG